MSQNINVDLEPTSKDEGSPFRDEVSLELLEKVPLEEVSDCPNHPELSLVKHEQEIQELHELFSAIDLQGVSMIPVVFELMANLVDRITRLESDVKDLTFHKNVLCPTAIDTKRVTLEELDPQTLQQSKC